MLNKKTVLALLLVGFIVLLRLLPHLPNVAPVAAAALVAGVYLGRHWAWLVPLGGLFLSDLVIGFYQPVVLLAVYGSFGLIGLGSSWLKNNKTSLNIFTASLAASLLFFLLTNFAVWLAADWYTPDWAGLALAFNLAVPFFRQTLIGDLLYTGLLFTVFETATVFAKHRFSLIRP